MSQKAPMTEIGAAKLRNELHELKAVIRPLVAQEIAEARALGDLKENAEYHAAREKQSFNEGRVGHIEGLLAMAEVIDVTKLDARGKVVFGATIKLEDQDTEEEVKYQIVGDDEADIKKNLVSISSPIARALIGREEGDIAVVKAPNGTREYEVIEIEYI